jgi:hypothetical protein
MSLTPLALAQAVASAPPAGGAAIDQVIIATTAAMIVTGGLLALGIGHRRGRITILRDLAGLSQRLSGIPYWAALPAGLLSGALIVALFGMMWDISLHIGEGRDEGPLANPAHYFILAGLFGVFAAGFLAIVLPEERPSSTAVRISGDWYAPLGGILIMACGGFSLIAFPLDDVWHRLFGQDVTLWGPTHLMLIGGAAATLVGLAVLLVEASRANAARGRPEIEWVAWLRRVALTGAFLLGLSTFQGEFDWGVPQFRFVFEPMLIMLAAGAALVAARVWLGRGAALGAALFFVAVRGGVALLVGPVLGEPTPYFPLYVAEALLVELVALRISPRDKPLPFAIAAGAAIGTAGLAAEWGWSQFAVPIPWPDSLLPEAVLLGLPMALASSLIGAWIGARLGSDRVARTRPQRWAGVTGAAAVAVLVAFALQKPADGGVSATVALRDTGSGPERTADATVTLHPRDAAEDAEWLTALAYQGGGLVVDHLERVSPGSYRTTEPLPVHGDWKTVIRLHDGNSLTTVPVYMPEDPAIPAEAIPAPPTFTREFVAEKQFLQREAKTDTAGVVTALSYGGVLAITLGFLSLVALGLHRLAAVPEAAAARDRATEAKETDGWTGEIATA